jgi:pimeloyl-ACP methyl ester carboxylesterase
MGSRIAALLLVFVGLGVAVDTQTLPDKYFDSNNIRIRYIEAGSGTPIILIHGLSRFVESNWINTGVFAALSKNYRVIAYDMPGHGKSGKPYEPSAYRDLAGDPIRLMDHLGIKRAHLLGYSLGGAIVARAAVTHPDRLITAILGGHSGLRDWQPESEKTQEAAARELESDVPFRSIAPLLLSGVANPTEEQIRAASASLAAENDPKALAALRRGGYRGLYNTISEAAAIRVPFLMVYGSLDAVKSGQAMQDILPGASLVVIDGATHGGEKSAARRPEFVAAIRQFLAAHR